MTAAVLDDDTIEQAQANLNQIAGGVAQLNEDDRKKVIGIAIASQLRHSSEQDKFKLLEKLLEKFGVALKPEAQASVRYEQAFGLLAPNTKVVSSAEAKKFISDFLRAFNGLNSSENADINDAAHRAKSNLEFLLNRLHEIAGKKRFFNMTVPELLDRIEHTVSLNQEAVDSAVRESFDRILTSINPSAIEGYVQESKIKVGPFHKAAMYDALMEKYKQLQLYHEKGRLVRDFKGMYRSHLKHKEKERGV
jgi:hypothetical protein